jgi:hypothetical protein
MDNSDIENTISLSITLNVFITAILSYLIPNNEIFIKEQFIPLISKYYSLAIVFLILSFVFFQIIKHDLTEYEKRIQLIILLTNLVFSVILLSTVIYPKFFGIFLVVIAGISACANLVIPSLYLLIPEVFKVYEIYIFKK